MKRLLLTIISAAFVAGSAFAYSFKYNDVYYDVEADGSSVTVVSGDEPYTGTVRIPYRFTREGTTYYVTTIGVQAFVNCTDLVSVIIASNAQLTTIGDGAFYNCSSMSSITLPNSLKSIGNFSFMKCKSLGSIILSTELTTIGEGAFSECESLSKITITAKVKTLGKNAFEKCTGMKSLYFNAANCDDIAYNNYLFFGSPLEEITFVSGCQRVPAYFAQSCHDLKTVDFGTGVKEIGLCAFMNCDNLQSVNIPKGVTKIEDSAFSSCCRLQSITVEAENTVYDSRDNCNAIIKTSSNSLLYGCKNTVIPQTVTSIYDDAFSGRLSLGHFVIPDCITSIGYNAFTGCIGLTALTIPKSVKKIGGNAFSSCFEIADIYSEPDPADVTLGENVFYDANTGKGKLHVYPNLYDAYCNAAQWKDYIVVGDLAGVDGVAEDAAEPTTVAVYNTKGQRLSQPQSGSVNIILRSDGSTKKIVTPQSGE